MSNVVQKSNQRRKVAQSILDDLNLIEKWARFGRPVVVGAFAYDLMFAADLDMEIYCPDLKIEHGFQVLAECALNPNIIEARFLNQLATPDKALYWQLRYKTDDGTECKIDMWSAPEDYELPRAENMIQPMRESLTPETRETILTLKKFLSHETTLACPSIDLYRAVLSDKVQSAIELRAWLATHETGELTDWKPQSSG